MKKRQHPETSRRQFFNVVAASAATLGISSLAPLKASAETLEAHLTQTDNLDPDEWFKQIKGKHKIVFDVTEPHDILPFAWPKVFLLTNEATGTPEKSNSVVVVLRHEAIPFAMEDRLWAKYKLGEVFKV